MHSLRNRRAVRAFAVCVASGLLILAPSRVVGQDSTAVPKTHAVKKGDTLWDLAAKYLTDAFRWPEIYRLNTDVIQDPHWIYPGELLKLPGYIDVGTPSLVDIPGARITPGQIAPPPNAIPIAAPPITAGEQPPSTVPSQGSIFGRRAEPQPTKLVPTPKPAAPRDTQPVVAAPQRAVPYGDFLRAPWVDRRQGPPVWGRIVGGFDIPGIDPARQKAWFQMNDQVLIAPPTGSVAPKDELYLAYRFGPLLEEIGQVIVPTGVVKVVRPPLNGDPAVATVVQMFGTVEERDRLMPYDSSGLAAIGLPTPVKNGIEGVVRWVADEPVLASVPSYVLLSYTSKDGVKIGDRIEFYQARIKATDVGASNTPEIHVGFAQIVRVTPFAATAIITAVDQPKVMAGTRVRVTAKMQ